MSWTPAHSHRHMHYIRVGTSAPHQQPDQHYKQVRPYHLMLHCSTESRQQVENGRPIQEWHLPLQHVNSALMLDDKAGTYQGIFSGKQVPAAQREHTVFSSERRSITWSLALHTAVSCTMGCLCSLLSVRNLRNSATFQGSGSKACTWISCCLAWFAWRYFLILSPVPDPKSSSMC